jgi:hypothetical protein
MAILPNVICVDYSAGKGGPLVAYSFDPERAREGEFTSAKLGTNQKIKSSRCRYRGGVIYFFSSLKVCFV